ncbi:MAG TPA: hypothetical protein VLR47_12715, partial [Rhodospirillales bacterium]|nr:hypothetical protein [Rhodospirillales bacterium]
DQEDATAVAFPHSGEAGRHLGDHLDGVGIAGGAGRLSPLRFDVRLAEAASPSGSRIGAGSDQLADDELGL